jgi:dipeptidase E
MKLVLYSGGDDKDNLTLDQSLFEMVQKKNPVMTFIPSSSYLSEVEFREFVRHYSKYKVTRFIHFPVDVPFDQTMFKEVMKSDIIHLAGGNTFYFLKYLRQSKMLPQLKAFVERGGILTGLSAGAIIMAAEPEFDRYENSVHLQNLKAMNLVDFYFFPHFRQSTRYDNAFKIISKNTDKMIYASPDGSGIIVDDNKITFVGKTFGFYQGKKVIIQK